MQEVAARLKRNKKYIFLTETCFWKNKQAKTPLSVRGIFFPFNFSPFPSAWTTHKDQIWNLLAKMAENCRLCPFLRKISKKYWLKFWLISGSTNTPTHFLAGLAAARSQFICSRHSSCPTSVWDTGWGRKFPAWTSPGHQFGCEARAPVHGFKENVSFQFARWEKLNIHRKMDNLDKKYILGLPRLTPRMG